MIFAKHIMGYVGVVLYLMLMPDYGLAQSNVTADTTHLTPLLDVRLVPADKLEEVVFEELALIRYARNYGNYPEAYERGINLLSQEQYLKDCPRCLRELYIKMARVTEVLNLDEIAYDLWNKANDYQLEGQPYAHSAPLLHRLGHTDQAIFYFKSRDTLFRQANKQLRMASNLNNLGFFFATKMNEPDSARFYYDLARSYIDRYRLSDTSYYQPGFLNDLEFMLEDNYIGLSCQQKEYALALDQIHTFQKRFSSMLGNPKYNVNWVSALEKQLQVYAALHQPGKLKELLESLEKRTQLKKSSFTRYSERKEHLLETYRVIYFDLIGDYKNKALQLESNMATQEQRLFEQRQNQSELTIEIIRTELENLKRRTEMEAKLVEQEAQLILERNRRNYILIIAFLLLISVTTALIYRQRMKRRKLLMERLDQERTHLKEMVNLKEQNEELIRMDLEAKQKDLINLSLRIDREQGWIARLVDIFEHMKQSRLEEGRDHIQNLVKEMKDHLMLDEKQQALSRNIELVSTQFREALRLRFPNLVETELELCELLRLNLSNTDIARIRNISPASVRTSKYRLRKKLKLNENQSLSELLLGM